MNNYYLLSRKFVVNGSPSTRFLYFHVYVMLSKLCDKFTDDIASACLRGKHLCPFGSNSRGNATGWIHD